MTDIAEKLRDYANDDHERLCQGRTYSCSCGYDDKRDPLMTEAADQITALRAENERLRAALNTLREVSRRAVQLSQQHPEFALWGMDPMWDALAAAARAALEEKQ